MTKRVPLEERFWSKVAIASPEECWEWLAYKSADGYGRFEMMNGLTNKGVPVNAHRIAYCLTNGEINKGLQIDHLCRNRGCVNPSHLEAVSLQENLRRGYPGANQRAKTKCPHGHPYDLLNTRFDNRGQRYCGECTKYRNHQAYHRRKNLAL